MESKDPYLEILLKRVEEADKADRKGMSLIDAMKPYQELYMYLNYKIELQILSNGK